MDALMQRHLEAVHSLAFRLSGDPDFAKTIVRETFLRVQQSLPDLRADANFTTWLYRIVTNVFLDERKKQNAPSHGANDERLDPTGTDPDD